MTFVGTYTIAGTKELWARLTKRLAYPGGKKYRAAVKRLARDFTPRPCSTLRWARWHQTANRHVAEDFLALGFRVSTVFLALDHNFFMRGPPILFETMIFRGNPEASDKRERKNAWREVYMDRYATWEEAFAGHQKAVREARALIARAAMTALS